MKEIEIIPTDESIEELWELRKKYGINKLSKITYEEFYKQRKKKVKALFG